MHVTCLEQDLIQGKHSIILQQALNKHLYVPDTMKNNKHVINHRVGDATIVYISQMSKLRHISIKQISHHYTASD